MDISKFTTQRKSTTGRKFSPSLFSHSLKASELPQPCAVVQKSYLGEDAGLHPSLVVRVPRPAARSSRMEAADVGHDAGSPQSRLARSSCWKIDIEAPIRCTCRVAENVAHSSTRQCRSRADPRARAQKPACRFRLLAARRSARAMETIKSKRQRSRHEVQFTGNRAT